MFHLKMECECTPASLWGSTELMLQGGVHGPVSFTDAQIVADNRCLWFELGLELGLELVVELGLELELVGLLIHPLPHPLSRPNTCSSSLLRNYGKFTLKLCLFCGEMRD